MFDIPVRIEGRESRKRSVAIFHVLAGLFLAANAGLIIKSFGYKLIWALLPIYLISIISMIFAFRLKKVKDPVKSNQWMRMLQMVAFLVSGFILVYYGNSIKSLVLFVWSGICLGLYLMERFIFSKPSLKITDANLQVPSLYSNKIINWEKIESVVIRQDFITINYLNNRYLQLEVINQLTGTEIEQISLFCNRKTAETIEQERQEIS